MNDDGVGAVPESTLLKGMVEQPGGRFRMGSDTFYPEERPVRDVSVDGLWIDRQPVTVAEFSPDSRPTYFLPCG